MKMNCWLILGAMLGSSVLAQQVTNPPPAAPIETPAPAPMATNAAEPVPPAVAAESAPVTNTPAAKPTKKKHLGKKRPAKRKTRRSAAAQLRTVPLVAGPAVVVATHVNIRGQSRLKSEVVGHLDKGQQVTVLQEITHNNSGPEEPSAWAKIVLPQGSHVWVNTAFIDATNKTVIPRRLNLRGGPGENYSILGRLHRGDAVTEVATKGTWTEIEAPTNAYAFVAAQYLKQEAPEAAAIASSEAVTPPPTASVPEAPMTTNAVPAQPEIAVAPAEAPAAPAPAETPAVTNAPAELAATTNAATEMAATTNEPAATPAAADEPPPKRIVEREGIVRGTFSIQAPTHFELYSPDTGKTLDYLYTSSPNLDLRRYKGLRIVVTGEEGLDDRWGNTPVITIQKIQVLE